MPFFKSKKQNFGAIVIALTCLPSHPAIAGSSPPTTGGSQSSTESPSANSETTSLITTQSPAFVLLGVSPQTVTSPSTPAALGADLQNGFDSQGNPQSGLAIDTVPFLLVSGADFSIEQYRTDANKNWWQYWLANTDVSLGTAKGASTADQSLKAAIGFQTTIFNYGDPRLDQQLQDCFDQEQSFQGVPPPGRQTGPSSDIPVPPQALSDWNDCKNASLDRNWNKPAWTVGAGWSASSPDGSTSKFRSAAWGVFSSLGYGFQGLPIRNSYAILQAQYLNDEQVANKNKAGTFIAENAPNLSAEYIYGVTPDLHVALTGGATLNMPKGQAEQTSYEVSAGTEFKIASGLWIQVNIGGSSDTKSTKGAGFILSQFTVNYSEIGQTFTNPRIGN